MKNIIKREGNKEIFPTLNPNNDTIIIEDGYKCLTYIPGNNIKITAKKEYFDSIIVDGEEKVNGESGILVISNLLNPVVN